MPKKRIIGTGVLAALVALVVYILGTLGGLNNNPHSWQRPLS